MQVQETLSEPCPVVLAIAVQFMEVVVPPTSTPGLCVVVSAHPLTVAFHVYPDTQLHSAVLIPLPI